MSFRGRTQSKLCDFFALQGREGALVMIYAAGPLRGDSHWNKQLNEGLRELTIWEINELFQYLWDVSSHGQGKKDWL